MREISVGFHKNNHRIFWRLGLKVGKKKWKKGRKDWNHKYVLVTQNPSPGSPTTLQTASLIAFKWSSKIFRHHNNTVDLFLVLIKTQVVFSPFVPVEFLVFHFCESPFDQSRSQKMPIETVSILTAGLCGCSHDPSVAETNDRLQSCLKSTSRLAGFPPSFLSSENR